MADFIIKDGGEYYNKGKRCVWVKLHDDTTHKFIVATPDQGTVLEVASPGMLPTDEEKPVVSTAEQTRPEA